MDLLYRTHPQAITLHFHRLRGSDGGAAIVVVSAGGCVTRRVILFIIILTEGRCRDHAVIMRVEHGS